MTSFKTPAALRAWLEKHHATATELVVRIWKVHAAARGVTNKQAVDEALCFGWIDGIRRSLDADSFSVRFTPRKPTSIWSAINIRRMAELEAEGRVRPAGAAAFAKRSDARSRVYSFEQTQPVELPPAMEKKLRANKKAAAFWDERPPWYRKVCSHWVISPKREETRESRLATLIACSARGEGIPPMYGRIGGTSKPAAKIPARSGASARRPAAAARGSRRVT